MSTVGQCKTDPTSGMSAVAWAALIGDADNGLIPAAATSNDPVRKLLAAQIQAILSAVLGAAIVGTASINLGTNSVTVSNTGIASTSVVLAMITQAAADATLTSIVRVNPSAGSCTIYGNANATAAVTIRWVVFN